MSSVKLSKMTCFLPLPDKQYRKNFQTFLNQRSWEDEIITKVQAEVPMQDGNEISVLISATKERIANAATGKSKEEERNRIMGMISTVTANPTSSARKSLEYYYNRGYLQELGIQWKP